jgi:23S rRNA (cytidine1920-2'-O)/16S rRNA (cytidine1409-2'-O)-methyltransferase
VVRSPELHREAVAAVVAAARSVGWYLHAVRPSRLPGPAGTREFFVLLRADPPVQPVDLAAILTGAPRP